MEVPNVVCTFAFAALEKWGSKNDKKKRSLIGFHEDREVVQEAPAALYLEPPGVENTSRQFKVIEGALNLGISEAF